MLKKGEDGPAGDRAMLQYPHPASPQRGHAVNLLDVVGQHVALLFQPFKACALSVLTLNLQLSLCSNLSYAEQRDLQGLQGKLLGQNPPIQLRHCTALFYP